MGTWINYEYPIAEKWTILTEVGGNLAIFGGSLLSKGVAVAGRVSFGSRYYYDRIERIAMAKNVTNNSGYFLQFISDYQPPGFSYISVDNRNIVRELRFIPSWGGRKKLGNSRWSFEGRIGIGYSYYLDNVEPLKKHNFAYDIRLAFGYTFLE